MKKLLIISIVLLLALFGLAQQTETQESRHSEQRALEVVEKVDQYFQQIKDAQVDVVLRTNLHLLGCSGGQTFTGTGYYLWPYRLKAQINGTTYFANRNQIRRIDPDGKKYYVRLLYSLDFTPGFRPSLIGHNFHLQTIKEDDQDIVIQGVPKAGVLKNVTKVIFTFSKDPYLIRDLDVKFVNKNLRGKLKIDYQQKKGLWVPVTLYGQSAVVIPGGFLVGMDLNLSGSNIKINTGLPAGLFDPGF